MASQSDEIHLREQYFIKGHDLSVIWEGRHDEYLQTVPSDLVPSVISEGRRESVHDSDDLWDDYSLELPNQIACLLRLMLQVLIIFYDLGQLSLISSFII